MSAVVLKTWHILPLILTTLEGCSIFPLQLVRGPRPIEVKYFSQNDMVRKCWRKDLNPKLSLSSMLTLSKFQATACHYVTFATCVLLFTYYSLTWLHFLYKYSINVKFISLSQVNYPNSHENKYTILKCLPISSLVNSTVCVMLLDLSFIWALQ